MSQITANHLTNGGSEVDANSYNTASISPGASRLVLLMVHSGVGGATNTPTVSGAGMTWTQIISSFNEVGRVTLFRALSASPGSGALTIDFAGQTQVNCAWIIDEFIDVDQSGTNGSGAIIQAGSANLPGGPPDYTGITVTLGAFSNTNNATYGALYQNVATMSVVVGSGFTELGRDTISSESVQSQWKNSNDTTVDWTWNSNAARAQALAVEIRAKSTAGFFEIL